MNESVQLGFLIHTAEGLLLTDSHDRHANGSPAQPSTGIDNDFTSSLSSGSSTPFVTTSPAFLDFQTADMRAKETSTSNCRPTSIRPLPERTRTLRANADSTRERFPNLPSSSPFARSFRAETRSPRSRVLYMVLTCRMRGGCTALGTPMEQVSTRRALKKSHVWRLPVHALTVLALQPGHG